MKAETSFSLKDQLVNEEKVDLILKYLKTADSKFKAKAFKQSVMKSIPDLELKERLQFISELLHEYLPQDYKEALPLLLKALPPKLDPKKHDDDFGEFIFLSHSLFVAKYGCSKTHLNKSLKALKEITQRFSAEEAIRFFINAFPEETLIFLSKCVTDSNYHVRRWVSEGTRPKLPWAQKIELESEKALKLLDALYHDPTRYVTRSVANHLNDISKLDPELVIQKLSQWKKEGKQEAKEMDYIIRHSLRTLIKQGHPKALNLLGFPSQPKLKILEFKTEQTKIKIGESLEFSINIKSLAKQKLLVDYIIEHTEKKHRKVFKLKQFELEKDEVITYSKKHPFKLMTTRSLHPGTYRLSLQVNGSIFGKLEFTLAV